MRVVVVIMVVGWAAFWIYWLVMSFTAKAGRSRWTQFAGFRVAIILVVLYLLRLRVFKGHAVTADPVLEGIGLAVFVLGLAVAIWARVYIGRNWGMPMSEKAGTELVTTGPYSRIRHPIYTGVILALVGNALAISLYWLIGVALIGGYFIYSAFSEERHMADVFPGTYPAYKGKTKMLIPFVL